MQGKRFKGPMVKGKIEEVIYAKLSLGDDLLRSIWDICADNDVKTGILMDATGCLRTLRVHAIKPGAPFGVEFADIAGALEVSAHGIIGTGALKDSVTPDDIPGLVRSSHDTGFGGAGFAEHGSPYAHIHIVASNEKETICGHLLEGSITATEYFEVVIAKVSGVDLRATWNKSGYLAGYRHELTPG